MRNDSSEGEIDRKPEKKRIRSQQLHWSVKNTNQPSERADFEMAKPGEDDGERAGDDRSPKRQRVPSLDEDENEGDDVDFDPASITEDEEDEEEEEDIEEEEEDDVTGTRIATIGNDFEDVVTEAQSGSQSSSSSQSVKLGSSDVLDCPTCCEPLKRPIYQCNNGHLACSSCCKKLNKRCSFCRSHIGDIRCRAMEKVIEASIVPCPNAKYGCKESTTYGSQSSHENVCMFARCSCPVPNCNYVGSYTNLKSHACAAHSWAEDDLIPLVFDRPLIFSMNLRKKMVVFKEEKESDLIVVQTFKGPEGMYVTVNRIAPMAPGIRNLSCTLAKLNQLSTLRIGMMVQKIQKVREQKQPQDNGFMFIPSYMIKDERWKMQICIGSERKYIHI